MRQETWDNIRDASRKFCSQSTAHQEAFSSIRSWIISSHMFSQITLMDNTVLYRLGWDDYRPLYGEQFVQTLNESLRATLTQNGGETNQRTEALKRLKELAQMCKQGAEDLETFTKVLQQHPFHQHDDTDALAIDKIVQLLKSDTENYVKGWRLTKYNKDGLKQERYLILTDVCYYTVKFDVTKKVHDTKHTKRHPLNDLNSIDIGTFQNTTQPVLYVVANEHVPSVQRTDSQLRMSPNTPPSPNNLQVPNIGSPRERPITSRSRAASMVGTPGGFYANIFVWERTGSNADTMTPTDLKRAEFTLKEIAYALFGVSNYTTRGRPPNLCENQSFQKVSVKIFFTKCFSQSKTLVHSCTIDSNLGTINNTLCLKNTKQTTRSTTT
jgi:hypothetical protein